ncbi:MAG TPA: transglycosylase domain-containing protein [Solirubrobacterales bacterium]
MPTIRSAPFDASASNGSAGGTRNGAGRPPRSPGGGGRNGRRARLEVIEGGGDPKARRPKLKKLRALLVIMGLSLLAAVSWVFGVMMAVAQDLPSLENRAQYEAAENSVMLDINGEEIGTVTNNEGRILVSSNEIAPIMKSAVVAIEDERFYEHRGVDFQGIARALYQDILSGSPSQGGSTITQQFVKNALEAQDSRTIFQKLREAALAYHLERQWSKDKILTEYLNSVYFGEGAYGIEAAAQTYFGYAHPGCVETTSCAQELLPWEAALLAAIISSPSAYSPRDNPEAAKRQRDVVLRKMMEQGVITEAEYQEYIAKELPVPAQIEPPAEDSEAPYFTSWVRQQLVDRYGPGKAFGGGLRVRTTLDLEFQRQVEQIAYNRVGAVGLDSAVVVLDNETAGVRAMVGGYDFEKSAFNLATNGQRQPGSSFKPFTLVTALQEGYGPEDVFASQPKQFAFKAKVRKKNGRKKVVTDIFRPANYEDSYLGSASLSSATTYSDNSVYAELGLRVGLSDIAETARKMGIRTDLRTETKYKVGNGKFEPYNPAMILGGLSHGVTPLEMTHAYLTLEEDGDRISGTMAASPGGPVGIEEVRDGDGNLVEDRTGASGENESVRRQVIDPEIADTATAMLARVVSSGTGTNAQTGEPTWGKTGTTDDNGDAWFCGATPDITACVWVGHADSNQPMTTEYGGSPVDGGTYPALIFADIVKAWVSLSESRNAEREARKAEKEAAEAEATEAVPAPTTTTPAPEATPVAPEPEPETPTAPTQQQQPAQPNNQNQGGSAPPPSTQDGALEAP